MSVTQKNKILLYWPTSPSNKMSNNVKYLPKYLQILKGRTCHVNIYLNLFNDALYLGYKFQPYIIGNLKNVI